MIVYKSQEGLLEVCAGVIFGDREILGAPALPMFLSLTILFSSFLCHLGLRTFYYLYVVYLGHLAR